MGRKPLAILLEEHIHRVIDSVVRKTGSKVALDTWNDTIKALQAGEHIYFSPGTMRMLHEKVEHYEETVDELLAMKYQPSALEVALQGFPAALFCYPEIIPVGSRAESIQGMFVYNPNAFIETGKDLLIIMLIRSDGGISNYIMQTGKDLDWSYSEPHMCDECRHFGSVILPCPECKEILQIWHHRYTLSFVIAGQYLAARQYVDRDETVVKQIPRKKNAKKTKPQVVHHHYKLIDANRIVIPISPTPVERTPNEGESWLQRALELDQVEYHTIRTRPFERTYRHPRYVNVQGQTVTFAKGIEREQPRKKDVQRTTKVVASDYEGSQ